MDLIRCSVCGEPLYTMSFGDALAHKLYHDVHALCSEHRQALDLLKMAMKANLILPMQ